eukprot:3103772-Alexandrium_andersonii.AAC.1
MQAALRRPQREGTPLAKTKARTRFKNGTLSAISPGLTIAMTDCVSSSATSPHRYTLLVWA